MQPSGIRQNDSVADVTMPRVGRATVENVLDVWSIALIYNTGVFPRPADVGPVVVVPTRVEPGR